ncbi:hypothetical protein [Polaribacter sp. Asnod1-A03]|uniref:hypothetical protein n=1 Tax=Polaribacter sp. Asnod1-A03 TaxID=3160581 RepID=UPI0038693660
MMNAETGLKNNLLNSKIIFFNCFESANDSAVVIGALRNMTDIEEHNLFIYYYDMCMDGAPYEMSADE